MRLVALLFLLCGLAFGKVIDAEYKVAWGIFSSVGRAYAHYEANATDYKIVIEGRATGLARIMSGNRQERYESSGKIVDGLLVPHKFVKIMQNSKKKRIKTFVFDHLRKKIFVTKVGYRKGKFEFKTQDILPYYAKDDLLTLYFNLKRMLKPGIYRYTFHAVGGDRKSGRVDIFLPQGKELAKLQRLLKAQGLYLGIVIHQKIFASKNGELFVVMGEDGVAKKGLLKDVIMYGDIVGTLVKKEMH